MKSNNQPQSLSRKGFTLLELMIVIAIIAVLVAIVIPVVGRMQRSSLTTSSTNNLKQIHTLMEGYVTENIRYPTARGVNLPPPTRHWRRIIWEFANGEFSPDSGVAIKEMEGSPYSEVMWCPLMVKRHGQDQHPWGRGSYALNNYFMDPSWGGGHRHPDSPGFEGRKEPFIMAGTLHPADSRFGTYTHITSSNFPYNTAWSNVAYEYGASGDKALVMFIGGNVETIPKKKMMELNELLRDPRAFE